MPSSIQSVPNQRILTINKQPTDRTHKYTCNNLDALGQAARTLQSKGGFKLYMYLAKNQDKYNFALSSTDFLCWSGLGNTAYRTAFDELVKNGYLIPKNAKNEKETIYTFFDWSKKVDEQESSTTIENPQDKVDEMRKIKEEFAKNF